MAETETDGRGRHATKRKSTLSMRRISQDEIEDIQKQFDHEQSNLRKRKTLIRGHEEYDMNDPADMRYRKRDGKGKKNLTE